MERNASPYKYDRISDYERFLSLRKIEQASEVFRKVTELNPNYADGYNNLGVALKDQGKFEKAVNTYKKAISINPDYADAHYNLGLTLKLLDKFEENISLFKDKLSVDNFALKQFFEQMRETKRFLN